MRIVTWNVNSLRVRLPRVLQLLEEHQPDVALLQETKSAPDTFPTEELREAGYAAVHNSGGQWAGVAVLARSPRTLSDPQLGLPGDPVATRRGGVRRPSRGSASPACTCPTAAPSTAPSTRASSRSWTRWARGSPQLSSTDVIVGGDMNIAPSDLDVYDPAAFVGGTHVSAPEREHLERMLAAGMVDAYRSLHPGEVQYTWWDYRAGNFHKGLGLRIDLLLVSRGPSTRLVSCGIDRDYRKGKKPSDHAPLLLELS